MTGLLLVMLGGGVGAVTRFVLDSWVRARATGPLPVGTLTVNVTGSFLIGVLTGSLAGTEESAVLLALAVGFCGGYTTFSTAVVETVRLVQAGEVRSAVGNLLVSLVLTVLAVAGGLALGHVLAA